jgi:hypothetical protein
VRLQPATVSVSVPAHVPVSDGVAVEGDELDPPQFAVVASERMMSATRERTDIRSSLQVFLTDLEAMKL